MRPSRSASRTMRSASGRVTAGSLSAAIVSASTSSAPIGVLSSWLTLATKSRRTLSTRWTSDTSYTNTAAPTISSCSSRNGTECSCSVARGGPNSPSSRSRRCALARLLEQHLDVSRGHGVGVARLAIPLGRRVAVDLGTVRVDHDDAVATRIEHSHESTPIRLGADRGREHVSELLLECGDRRLFTPQRAHRMAFSRTVR